MALSPATVSKSGEVRKITAVQREQQEDQRLWGNLMEGSREGLENMWPADSQDSGTQERGCFLAV